MNKDFPRILTMLRKEKHLSQKEAAAGLSVSQALLSHYEKGIRECGLSFLVKAADYYDVSCDYLLGRTAERDIDIPEAEETDPERKLTAALSVSRRLITNSVSILYDLLNKAGNRKLSRSVTNYFMLSVYRVFRCLYSANGENPRELFTMPQQLYAGYASAEAEKLCADIEMMTDSTSGSCVKSICEMSISPDTMAEEYHETSAALYNVTQQAENLLHKIKR